jgi:hypothetical protein
MTFVDSLAANGTTSLQRDIADGSGAPSNSAFHEDWEMAVTDDQLDMDLRGDGSKWSFAQMNDDGEIAHRKLPCGCCTALALYGQRPGSKRYLSGYTLVLDDDSCPVGEYGITGNGFDHDPTREFDTPEQAIEAALSMLDSFITKFHKESGYRH